MYPLSHRRCQRTSGCDLSAQFRQISELYTDFLFRVIHMLMITVVVLKIAHHKIIYLKDDKRRYICFTVRSSRQEREYANYVPRCIETALPCSTS
jgi:hypothetical protein